MSGTRLAPVASRRTAVPGRGVVPWTTVLPLAVVVAYADGFWLMALRGATGSVARTQTPFASYLSETTLALPLFTLAVLGGLMLTARRYGPAPQTLRGVVAGATLVVVAGSVAGTALMAANAAYDFSLQAGQLSTMGSMGGSCLGSCTDTQLHAAAALQLRTVGIAAPLLLVTNAVAVAWVVALRGGRLVLEAPRRAVGGLRLSRLLSATLLAGGLLHAAVVPEHLQEWPAAGVFFVLLAGVQLALGAGALWRPHRGVVLFAAAVSAGALALWVVSRTVGMPTGPEPGATEAVGLTDVVCCLLELVTLVVAVLLVPRRTTPAPGAAVRLSAPAARLVLLTVLGVTSLGLAGSDLPGVGVLASSMTMVSH